MAGLENAYRPDGEFIAYTFAGSPPAEQRLWFLDRQLATLLLNVEGWPVSTRELTWSGDIDIDVGTWSTHIRADAPLDALKDGVRLMDLAAPGVTLRYDHHGDPPWSMVWQLTDITIPHVHNFGHDDTWRLGVWPD